MWLCYILALVPFLAGAVLWMVSKRVVWFEWLIGSVIAFMVAGVFHYTAIKGMIADEEMRSGWITSVSHHPRWVEEYQQMHTRTVGSGKNQRTEIYFTTEHTTHSKHWTTSAFYGSTTNDYGIGEAEYLELKAKFGGEVYTSGRQCSSYGGHRDSGDNNIYTTDNKTRYTCPANKFTSFENRVKAAPSVFSFAKPPANIPVFDYPQDVGWKQSDRLKGGAKNRISIYDWDCLNARLGPDKKVNVILVGFNSTDSELGHMQQAKWVGGKKNDLVLTYGVDGADKVVWTYVFGWTEQEIVKRNLETILLQNPIDSSILPLIEKEIRASYTIKDWTKFDYITVEPPTWAYLVLVLVVVIVQSGYWFWAIINGADKETGESRTTIWHSRRR